MKRIVWLASYPKSGNTWFRIFLTNYLRDGDRPADINDLADGWTAGARVPFDAAVGYDSGDLTFEEIDALRPEVYRHLAQESDGPRFMKVHDAYTWLPDGRALFPAEATAGVLYFVRNPLDVAVSLAEHTVQAEVGSVIAQMGSDDHCVGAVPTRQAGQLRQRLRTWSAHARSWLDESRLPVQVIRYEDLLARPEEYFAAAVKFAGLPFDAARLAKAVRFSRFEEVQAQEARSGFSERSRRAKAFFRRGTAGGWQGVLTDAQVDRIVREHGETMRRFGYLDEAGRPVG